MVWLKAIVVSCSEHSERSKVAVGLRRAVHWQKVVFCLCRYYPVQEESERLKIEGGRLPPRTTVESALLVPRIHLRLMQVVGRRGELEQINTIARREKRIAENKTGGGHTPLSPRLHPAGRVMASGTLANQEEARPVQCGRAAAKTSRGVSGKEAEEKSRDPNSA